MAERRTKVSGYARVTRTKGGGVRITRIKPYRRRKPKPRDGDATEQEVRAMACRPRLMLFGAGHPDTWPVPIRRAWEADYDTLDDVEAMRALLAARYPKWAARMDVALVMEMRLPAHEPVAAEGVKA